MQCDVMVMVTVLSTGFSTDVLLPRPLPLMSKETFRLFLFRLDYINILIQLFAFILAWGRLKAHTAFTLLFYNSIALPLLYYNYRMISSQFTSSIWIWWAVVCTVSRFQFLHMLYINRSPPSFEHSVCFQCVSIISLCVMSFI